jgi:Rne/Rng family ribonuclease
MSKEMVISANPHETRVAILEEGQLCEYYVEREKEFALVGSIYKGRVTRVLPGMQSAFVDIGLDSDAFLYVTDFLEDVEDFDQVTTVEEKVQKMEDQGGHVFPANPLGATALEPADVESMPPAADASAVPLETLTSEDAAPPQNMARPVAPFNSTSPSHTAPPQDRGRFGNRGRDFGRRGGSGGGSGGGRRGGRHGGSRGGSSGGSGSSGRGGERRFGRELPSSKYASHRPYDGGAPADAQSESGPPSEGHVSVILPGESFAKYREKPPTSAPGTSQAEDNFTTQTPGAAPEHDQPQEQIHDRGDLHERHDEHQHAQIHEPALEPIRQEVSPLAPVPPAHESRSSHSEQRSFSSSGLEPLPGESLSKYKRPEPSAQSHREEAPREESHSEGLHSDELHNEGLHNEESLHKDARQQPAHPESSSAPYEMHEERAEPPAHDVPQLPGIRDKHAAHEHHDEYPLHESYAAPETELPHAAHDDHEDHPHPELSEDEAATIAEHVAEAQIEEAARTAQDRSFASDEESHAAGLSSSEQSAAESEEEDHEVEEEEADAESEGMIAPPHEDDHHDAEHADDLAANPESVSPESGISLASDLPPALGQQPSQARVRDDFRPRMQHPSRRGGRDRGRRDDRGRRPQHGRPPQSQGHHRPQPRRPMLIADLLKQGQEIIVQIAKEPLGKKGARITSHVALPGRSLVYMPTLDHTGVSRKIASAEERSRLRHLVNDAKGAAGGGFIVRTAAGSAAPDEVRADVEFLTRTWSEIKSRSEQRKAPSILHRDLNLVERILRDFITPDFAAIWVDTEEEYTKVVDFMSRFQPQLVNRVKLYTKETPVFEEFGIQQEIDKGLRPKVWLKSGGYIVINHTEALVAIDVNTGKFVGKGSNRLEDTIVRTNLEATKEIVRQMRLRDLGGIIVIDFIDMEDRRNREKVMAALEDALRADRAPSKMLRFNEFGLIAITRKRTKQALERTLCQPCPYCTGSGMVKSIPTLCYEIQTEARKMAPEMDSGSLTLRVHPEIAKALKTRESSLIEELERWTKKSAIIQADPTLHWEQYDIY